MKPDIIYMITILQLMIANVISISDSDIFYPQLLRVKVPVRPPSISSIQIFNKLKSKVTNSFGPERRMIFPFNRLVLSMVAPRLMRFQFDMMIHSIISELVRKVVIPIMGSISANNDIGRPGILSQLLSPQTPSQSSPSPAFDVKQMISKAQNAIVQQGMSLQNAIRMNEQLPSSTSPLTMANLNLQQLQADQMGLSQNSLNPLLQYHNFGIPINNLAQPQISNTLQPNLQQTQYIQAPSISSIESLMNSGQALNMNQVSFMTNPQTSSASDESSTKLEKQNIMRPKWTTKVKGSAIAPEKKPIIKTLPQYQIEYVQSNSSHSEEEPVAEVPKEETESQEYQLNYVDTNLPNYGNQLSTQQINQYSIKEEDQAQDVSDSQMTGSGDSDKTHQQISEEIERASRWNDILVNMDKYDAKRRFMTF